MTIPYTVFAMPSDEKPLSNLFQFKLNSDEYERWSAIVKAVELRAAKAKLRALEKGESFDEVSKSDINRALVGMKDARAGIVTEPERQRFLGIDPPSKGGLSNTPLDEAAIQNKESKGRK